MPRFKFALDPLLDLRRREEDLCKREVGRLEQIRQALQDRLTDRQRDIAEGKELLRSSLIGSLDAGFLRQQAASIISVDQLARRTVIEFAGVAQHLSAAQAVLIEAAKRRRAIEILRERRLEEWKREEGRKETAFLDDLANSALARTRMEGLDA
ncbi:MAG: flagellar export protein FliJ [Phycisphaerae bacterium]|nr:flagellar export protein FliJ [Phycisphaerae bacterium]